LLQDATRINASPTRRFSCERSAKIPVIARAFTSSFAQGLPVTAGQRGRMTLRSHGLSRRVGWRISRRPCVRGFQDAGLLDHAREVRDRPFIDDLRLGFFRLPDFRQVAAGQDRQEARCHPVI
jgi:hypothetical protein